MQNDKDFLRQLWGILHHENDKNIDDRILLRLNRIIENTPTDDDPIRRKAKKKLAGIFNIPIESVYYPEIL